MISSPKPLLDHGRINGRHKINDRRKRKRPDRRQRNALVRSRAIPFSEIAIPLYHKKGKVNSMATNTDKKTTQGDARRHKMTLHITGILRWGLV